MANVRRAVGIIRVSQTAGRAGDSFTSPKTQRERIEAECEREGLQLVACFEEMDTSGGKSLDARPRLSEAVRMVEAGEAEVIVAAYFDRLVRSLTTQTELLARVEAAGGQVRAVDAGAITAGTSGEWLDSTMRGMMAEYQRRQGAERSRDAQADAIARGVPLWSRITAGYRRTESGTLEPDAETVPLVAAAFEMRAAGRTIPEIRLYLREHGIDLSQRGVTELLKSRVVLGELHFGSYEPNLEAWPAIIDRELWRKAQRTIVSRGAPAKSERLLARLGILRCGNCGARMTASSRFEQARGDRPSDKFYRCGVSRIDCDKRASVGAIYVEGLVTAHALARSIDAQGRASVAASRRHAAADLEAAQTALDDALLAFAGFASEPAAVRRLTELAEARDAARERVEQLGPTHDTLTVDAVADWDHLSLDERRAVIRATIARVDVTPGRGPDRVEVTFVE